MAAFKAWRELHGAVGVLQRLLELAEANVRVGTVGVEPSRRGASGTQLDRLRAEPRRRSVVLALESLRPLLIEGYHAALNVGGRGLLPLELL